MADFNSSLSAEQIESRLLGAVVTNATQEWTEQQKAQARANIGAGTSDSGLQIQGYFNTYEELVAAITSPKVGATYAVGTGEPYEIYIWDALNNVWRANGFIRGADGTDANVTTENIVAALGYTPAATDGSNMDNGAVTQLFYATLYSGGWSEDSGFYRQRTTVQGFSSELPKSKAIVDINFTTEDLDTKATVNEAWALVMSVELTDTGLSVWATDRPRVTIPIKILVVMK